jgi:hypothetical protein
LPIENEEEESGLDLSLLPLSNGSSSRVTELTTMEEEVVVDASLPFFNRVGFLPV